MADMVRKITKALAVEEDILFGEGVAQQERAGESYLVTKVRSIKPINNVTELEDLDPTSFPKVALCENGSIKFLQYNGAEYEQLTYVRKVVTIETPITAVSALAKDTIQLSSSSPHSIANLTEGLKGQVVTLIALTANTTITNGSNIFLKTGSDYTMPINTGVQLQFTGTVWAEI